VFGKRQKYQIVEDREKESTIQPPIFEPYQDEPQDWNALPDNQRAEKWYQLAAFRNTVPNIGDTDPLLWYTQAAENGDAAAQYTLGKLYCKGILTDQNPFQASLWYAKASSAGSPFADYELAKMLERGIGLQKDETTARYLYQKSCEAFLKLEQEEPNPAVELKLAVLYEKGLTGETDQNAALHWRQLAEQNSALKDEKNQKESVSPIRPMDSPADAPAIEREFQFPEDSKPDAEQQTEQEYSPCPNHTRYPELLQILPTAPGKTCTVLFDGKELQGEIHRIELQKGAIHLAVSIVSGTNSLSDGTPDAVGED
jgi:hypothetical protein